MCGPKYRIAPGHDEISHSGRGGPTCICPPPERRAGLQSPPAAAASPRPAHQASGGARMGIASSVQPGEILAISIPGGGTGGAAACAGNAPTSLPPDGTPQLVAGVARRIHLVFLRCAESP